MRLVAIMEACVLRHAEEATDERRQRGHHLLETFLMRRIHWKQECLYMGKKCRTFTVPRQRVHSDAPAPSMHNASPWAQRFDGSRALTVNHRR